MSSAPRLNEIDTIVQQLRSLQFFATLDDLLLRSMAPFCINTNYLPGSHILSQGQLNDTLHFLIQGKVAVLVDNALVTHLDQRGDLLGEMSVISQKPCAATLRAETATEVLSINADIFTQIAASHSEHLVNNLYRLYAIVLADRVRVTNEKAKHFEKLTLALTRAQDELKVINQGLEIKVLERTKALQLKTEDLERSHQKLESQNAALTVSNQKIAELYNTRDVTFARLEHLYRQGLKPFGDSLVGWAQNPTSVDAKFVQAMQRKVHELNALLEPMTSLFSIEKSMKAKRILLAESNKKQQLVARMALGGTGVDVVSISSVEELQSTVSNNDQFDIVLCDKPHMEHIREMRERWRQCRFVFISSEPVNSYIELLRSQDPLPDIVSYSESDRAFTVKNIMTTVAKLAAHDIFGLEKYLSWGVEVQAAEVTASHQRESLIEEMSEYLKRVGVRTSVRDRAALVAEELLMNAIYDAPTDSDGKPLYNHLTRQNAIELAPEHYSRFRYAADGLFVAISVTDPFGALSGQTVLNYLESCYSGNAGSLNTNKGGAGRGLHVMIETSDLMVFNIHKRIKTEVIALFNVDPKENLDKKPALHLFTR